MSRFEIVMAVIAVVLTGINIYLYWDDISGNKHNG